MNLDEMRSAAGAMPDGICVIRSSGRIVLANRVIRHLSGHSERKLLRMQVGDILPDIPELAPCGSLSDGAVHTTVDGSMKCANGATLPVSVSVGSFEASDEGLLLVTVRDLGHQRTIEYRLRQELLERGALNHIAAAVNSDLELNRIFRTVATEVKRLIPYDRISVSLISSTDPGCITTVFTSGVKVEGYDVGCVGKSSSHSRGLTGPKPGVVLMNGDEPLVSELKPACEAGLWSWLMVPLGPATKPAGFLSLRSVQKYAYSLREVALLESVAAQVTPAIFNAQMHHETRRVAEVRKVLTGIGRVISSSLEIETIFDEFATLLCSLVLADRVVIAYIDSEKQTVRDAFTWGVTVPEWDSGEPRPFTKASSSRVAKLRDGLIESSDDFPAWHRSAGLASGMYAPLVSNGRLIGSLNVKSKTQAAYTQEDLRTLRMVAAQISGAVAASQLYERTLELSAQRELAVQLNAENRQLKSENDFKARLISTVSHELRTPLTSVMAFADLLKRNSQGNLTQRQLEQIELIRKGSRSLFLVIDDLLFASRIEAGTLNLDIQPFELSELAQSLTAQLQVMADSKDQTLVVTAPKKKVVVTADRLKLTQAISNLVTNAFKYSDDGTQVDLRFVAGGGRLRIEVTDRGIGINESDVEELFKTYFRADNDATRSQQGTGLGLYIVKTITELHGGDVTVESEPASGSTFTIDIPLDCSTAIAVDEDAHIVNAA